MKIEKKQEPENWFLVKCNLRYFTKKRTMVINHPAETQGEFLYRRNNDYHIYKQQNELVGLNTHEIYF
jgi:hypothetical protein